MPSRAVLLHITALAAGLVGIGGLAATTLAQDDSGAATEEEKPYTIAADGTVDWPVYNGFRRYNGICFVCHGPDGMGSSFAPGLVDSLETLPFGQFLEIVVNGKETVNTANEKKMPALGNDPNVMCYINDIYAYLRARSDGAVGRGRPPKFEKKSEDYAEAEAACMGTPG